MKKLLALLLAACMVLSFASCAKETSKDDEIPTLVWYMFGNKQPDNALVMEKVNEITVPAIGAKLEIKYIDSGAYDERMKMNMTSGDSSYDLCFTGYINAYANAAEKGGLLDITNYIEEMPGLKAAVPDYLWEGVTIDGKIYAVPNQQVLANSSAIFVKKDVADEYGLNLDDIVYLEDLEPFLKWVKEKHPELYPFRTSDVIANYKGRVARESLATGISAVFDEDGKTIAMKTMDMSDFETYPRLLSDWYKKGYIRQDVAAVMEDTQDLNAGKYAVFTATWKPGVIAEIFKNRGYEVYGKLVTEQRLSGMIGAATMIGVNRTSKNPEKAVKFIELINTNKELYNLICFGIEGKHYEMKNNRAVVNKDAGYAPSGAWQYGNQFNALLLEGQEDNIWEETKKFNDEAVKFDTIGFVFDSSNVKAEYAQVRKVNDKYRNLYRGEKNVDEFLNKYREEMQAAGLDKVFAEVKKQLEEFQAKK